MTSLEERVVAARADVGRGAVILSPNPIHDTGGGQRSAQLAVELLERGWCVLFVSHGRVTETRDLGLRFPYARLVETNLGAVRSRSGRRALGRMFDGQEGGLVVTQVPVREWLPILDLARGSGARTVFDLIDLWDSELGAGWYRPRTEARLARACDLLVATAPVLVRRLEAITRRQAHLLPNAYNGRVFRRGVDLARPQDLPPGRRVALYVGALWGGWLDWDLVRRAATEVPDTTFAFVGDHRGEGGALPANCVFLGLKAQGDLPAYLAHAEVGFLPWRADQVTSATSPLKAYEFLAMGLPIVAPRIEPLEGMPGVALTPGPERFVAAVRTHGRGSVDAATATAMATFAEASSWATRVDTLLQLAGAPRGGRGGGRAGASGLFGWIGKALRSARSSGGGLLSFGDHRGLQRADTSPRRYQ